MMRWAGLHLVPPLCKANRSDTQNKNGLAISASPSKKRNRSHPAGMSR
jgi:hypothetical protein